MQQKKIVEKKIEVSPKILGAILKTSLRVQKSNAELKELLSELLERPGLAKEHLTVAELTKEYGVSRKQLEGFKKKGMNVIQKVPNGKIWIKRSEIDKFFKK